MSWTRRLSIGAGVAIGLLILAAAGLAIWKSQVPAIEMVDPAPDGRRVVEDGLLINYYPGRGPSPRAGILLLGGAEGALGEGASRTARALQAEGFSVAHLSYFRAPGQPQRLALVPLELFGKALVWLGHQRGVDPNRLAVVGASKGAEAALLVGSRHPELKAVVAGMPSSVVWPGIDWRRTVSDSSWSEGGKPLAALAYGKGDDGRAAAAYESGLAAFRERPDARIPVERTAMPKLLICGGEDTVWPSCPMARQLHDRDAAHVHVLAYPKAGHAVFGPPLAATDPRYERLGGAGGTADDNAAARADGWPKVVAFLKGATKVP